MTTTRKLDRNFGKCRIRGCRTRLVVDGSFIDGKLIHYNGLNRDELRSIGAWCDNHDTFLTFNPLRGRMSPDKECNAVCMGAVGPSCDCSCGGENHGLNHVSI